VRIIASFILLILITSIDISFAGYGDKTNGLPNWQERAILVLTNACRMAPTQYRDAYVGAYSILLPENYPAVKPVYWNMALNESARFHAIEMADTCGMTHNSCNGESFLTRIQKYYTKSSTVGEDIATGNATPQATMQQWLMDATNNVPAVDNSTCGTSRCDGHRWNIMNNGYREMGTGYDSGAMQYKYFWCQDFGGGKPEFDNPIISGVHLFLETGKTTFMANFFDSLGKPQDAAVYIDNQKTALTLLMGADSAGTYGVALIKGADCRYYYFSFTDSRGTVWRYPETGYLVTRGEGTCTRDFIPPESLSVNNSIFKGMSGYSGARVTIKKNVLTAFLMGHESKILHSSIFDVRGRKLGDIIWKMDDGKSTYQANIGQILPGGVYFVNSSFSDGISISQRLEVIGKE